MTTKQKKDLYNEAIAFYDLAELGRKHIPEQKQVESFIPYIINMAFCIELLLKLLLVHQGESIKKLKSINHDIETLYNLLSEDTKELIKNILYPKKTTKPPFPYKIDEELRRTKNAFVQWRYLVLDKARLCTNETAKERKIPFFKWKDLSNDEKNELDKKDIGQRMQICPFFLKGFSEALIEACKKKEIIS